jgi:protoporphyrinogen oxidase
MTLETTVRNHHPVVVIGAGPAGLTAAYESVSRGLRPVVLEKADKVGGIARTETYKGYRLDVGGHRFFTKEKAIQQLWEQMLGEDLVRVSRLSRIYYQGRLFKYPLDPFDALSKLGLVESMRIVWSYVRARLQPYPEEKTFEQWMVNRFGRRLYASFFQGYTEKVWGIPCSQIQADWAAQRIQGLSLRAVVSNALLGTNSAKTLIDEFQYPTLGPGMMWQRFREAVEAQGGQVWLQTEAVRLEREENRVTTVWVEHQGEMRRFTGEHFISSMPLADLITRLDPLPPDEVVQAAQGLGHRDFILVGLIVNRADAFPDQWIYVHDPQVQVGRIQNFRNWSAALVPDPQKTSLGAEYFCTERDDLWQMADADLVNLATRELTHLGLVDTDDVEDGIVIRQPKAYPLYDGDYRNHVAVIRRFLATVDNLQTIGRNGMHRYNNADHSMLTGMLAVENFLGQSHDLWNVNTERDYHEQIA